jgi:hypothetical protein
MRRYTIVDMGWIKKLVVIFGVDLVSKTEGMS